MNLCTSCLHCDFLLRSKKMLWAYSFHIGISEGKLLKRPGPDVGCRAIEEEGTVFKMQVTVKRCIISNNKTVGILLLYVQ
jgi:hypothetical protein